MTCYDPFGPTCLLVSCAGFFCTCTFAWFLQIQDWLKSLLQTLSFQNFTFFWSLNLESRKQIVILKNVAICSYLTLVHPCAETCCPLPNHSWHTRLHAPTNNRRTARNATLEHIRYQCPLNIKTCLGIALSNASFDCKMSRPRHSLKFGQILMSVRFIAPAALWHFGKIYQDFSGFISNTKIHKVTDLSPFRDLWSSLTNHE